VVHSDSDTSRTTRLLNQLGKSDAEIDPELVVAVYDELRILAQVQMRHQRPSHTLQPTALVNEAWLKLFDRDDLAFESRSHFYALAAKIMRSVLVDHARAAKAEKRGGGWRRISFDGNVGSDESGVDLLALDDCLGRLKELDPELCHVVELRFFGGLSLPQVAEARGFSLRTAERHWRTGCAWLHAELSG
jgi:RNA polymerase sigma factor (TIGR02999 family)